MKTKILYLLSVGITAIVCLVLSSSCATTKTASKTEGESVQDETPKEIKITEFILGSGDVIDIAVWRHNELSKKVQIDPYGKFMYPLIGEINANGISVLRLSEIIKEGLSNYLVDPNITVSIVSIKSQKVYVVGEVIRPGVFSMDTPMSAIEAISQAGGFTLDAKDESVIVIRGNRDTPQLIKLDLEDALKGIDFAQNIQLKGGDIVYVPPTFIADVSRFSVYLKNILSPILMIEQGIILEPRVEDVFEGETGKGGVGSTITIERP